MDELRCITQSFPSTLHLIILTETWIKSDSEALNLTLANYTHYYNYRNKGRGGGVSIYVHNSLQHNLIEDLYDNDNHFLWIHINRFSLDIGVVYKPERTNNDLFLETYSMQLERRKRAIVFGDFNYDLLKNNQAIINYKMTMEENGFNVLNKINRNYCTRETLTSKTILDHVSSNLKNNKYHFTIMNSAMSDHKHIYLEVQKFKPEKKKRIKYIAMNYQKLYETLEENLLQYDNLDYIQLEKQIIEAITHSKIQKTKIQNPPKSDWINKDIIDAIDERNKILSELFMSANDEEAKKQNVELELLRARKEVRDKIQDAKSRYYYKKFKSYEKKPLKMWQLITSLSTNKTKNCTPPSQLQTDSNCLTNLTDICNCFNSFFVNIGAVLAKQIPPFYHDNATYKQLYNKNIDLKPMELSQFAPVTIDEVSKIIDNLNSNTTTGLDGISCKIIKSVKKLILEKLTNCINDCLKTGYFPDSLKLAKVSPIFKTGKKTDPGNYRPISVLPVISKIFEKTIYNRLDQYLLSIDFLYYKQYGFRPKSNTRSACIDLVTNLKCKIDERQICLGIFIDLKKAFDTISHKLLLQKLNDIGVKESAYRLIESYLSNRHQVVKICDAKSTPELITYGVPQGSILGPLLFLIYINNMKDIKLTADITLYADDTCLFYYGNEIQSIAKQAQDDLNILHTWLQYNLLTINVMKTKYMIFTAKNKKDFNMPTLHVNNEPLTKVQSQKYLGLTLDSHLTWKPHLDNIRAKLTSLMGILRGVVRCFPESVRYIIYNSLIKPHITYLIEVWGSATKTNTKPLQIAQNKIIKLLFHFNFRMSTETVFQKAKLMTLAQTYHYQTCILIRKILTKDTHSQIVFTKKIQTQTRQLRSAHNLCLYKPRTNYGIKNIKYEGAKIYNNLPKYIKEIQSFPLFKKTLKFHITKI